MIDAKEAKRMIEYYADKMPREERKYARLVLATMLKEVFLTYSKASHEQFVSVMEELNSVR